MWKRGNRVVERRLETEPARHPLCSRWVSRACSISPRVPAVGALAGQTVATTVDSELAKYYLESYLPGWRIDPSVMRGGLIDSALQEVRADPTDREAMERLTRRSSTDLATLYFVARLYDIPVNRRAQDAFHAALQRLHVSGIDAANSRGLPG